MGGHRQGGRGARLLDALRAGSLRRRPRAHRRHRGRRHGHHLIGGGAPRVLGFAGANADIVGVNPSIASGEIDVEAARDGLPDRIDQKLTWVREGAGGRYADVEINAWLAFAEVTDDASATAEPLAGMFDTTPDEVLASPITLIGSRREIEDRLRQRRDRWDYSYTVIPRDKARAFAPIVSELTGS